MNTRKSAAKAQPISAASRPARTPKARQRQPEEIKARILKAAFAAFSTHGFEGTSTRTVAADAHVSLSLLLYHFQSKDALWRAVVEDQMNAYARSEALQDDDESAPPDQRLRAMIRGMVHWLADVPGMHRLVTFEGHQLSSRLTWLCDTYVKKDFEKACELIVACQKNGTVRQINPAQLRFAIIAMSAVPFAVAAEYQYLTNRNPLSRAEVENTIDLINRLVFEQDPPKARRGRTKA
jgi:TetR/AcrR family transcriptional regulator